MLRENHNNKKSVCVNCTTVQLVIYHPSIFGAVRMHSLCSLSESFCSCCLFLVVRDNGCVWTNQSSCWTPNVVVIGCNRSDHAHRVFNKLPLVWATRSKLKERLFNSKETNSCTLRNCCWLAVHIFVVILCVFALLCVYCCFYFRCRTAG